MKNYIANLTSESHHTNYLSLKDFGSTYKSTYNNTKDNYLNSSPTISTIKKVLPTLEDRQSFDYHDFLIKSTKSTMIHKNDLKDIAKLNKIKSLKNRASKLVEDLFKKKRYKKAGKTSENKKEILLNILDPKNNIERILNEHPNDKSKFKSYDLQIKCMGSEQYRYNLIKGVQKYEENKYFFLQSKSNYTNFQNSYLNKYKKLYEMDDSYYHTYKQLCFSINNYNTNKNITNKKILLTKIKNKMNQKKSLDERINDLYYDAVELNNLNRKRYATLHSKFEGYSNINNN